MLCLFRNDHRSPRFKFRPKAGRGLKLIQTTSLLLFFAGLAFLTFFEVRFVRGESMMPLFREGTVLLINRWAYGPRLPIINNYLFFWNTPQKKDIVAFFQPGHLRESVKLVASGAGESLVIEQGFLVALDRLVPLAPYQRVGIERLSRVPPNQVFVIGLNYESSTDSRDYGPIPLVLITGRVIFSVP